MKKKILISILFTVCLYLAGCGSPDRNRQSEAQLPENVQAAKAMPEVKKQDMGEQAAEDTDILQEQAQDAQTEWDGEEKDLQEQLAEIYDGTDEGSEEYKVEFLGVDSDEILSCTIYHGDTQEEIDLKEAKGKCLLQMLDDFFKDPRYGYEMVDDIVCWPIAFQKESLKRKDDYYIYIELGKSISYSLPGAYLSQEEEILKNFNTVIVETYQDSEGEYEVFLDYNIENEDYFYQVGCPDCKNGEDFLSRYHEWEQTEDWDAALANRKEGHK